MQKSYLFMSEAKFVLKNRLPVAELTYFIGKYGKTIGQSFCQVIEGMRLVVGVFIVMISTCRRHSRVCSIEGRRDAVASSPST